MDRKLRVAIIGGGISGLSSAYYLNKRAAEKGQDFQITILESADYWGGKIKTEIVDGFVIEGGPDAYLLTKPWMRALAHELGMGADLQGTNPNFSETFIVQAGKLTTIPSGLSMTIPSEFFPVIKTKLMTWPQKIRMAFDLIIPARREDSDESLAGFISRRLGRAAYEYLVGPLLSGIYAGDGDRLSLQATFPILREMELEHGSLIKGAIALRKKRTRLRKKKDGSRKSKAPSIFESPKSGLGSIANALVSSLEKTNVDMRLKTPVKKIVKKGSGYLLSLESGDELEVDALVLATPTYISGHFLELIAPVIAKELSQIEHVSTATVSLAYRKEDVPTNLEGYGYIIPQQEESEALACTWTSSKWEHRAPEGIALLRVFLGRIQDDEPLPQDEETLIALAKSELGKTLDIKVEPMESWVFRWEKAMPQYNLGHPERIERIEAELLNFPNLALAGNGYYGIGLPDCVNSGIQAAEKLLTTWRESE